MVDIRLITVELGVLSQSYIRPSASDTAWCPIGEGHAWLSNSHKNHHEVIRGIKGASGFIMRPISKN